MASALYYHHSSFVAVYSDFLELLGRFDNAVSEGTYETHKILWEIENFLSELDVDGSLAEIAYEIFTGRSQCLLNLHPEKGTPEVHKAVHKFLLRISPIAAIAA